MTPVEDLQSSRSLHLQIGNPLHFDSNTTFDERNLYTKALRISILSIFCIG